MTPPPPDPTKGGQGDHPPLLLCLNLSRKVTTPPSLSIPFSSGHHHPPPLSDQGGAGRPPPPLLCRDPDPAPIVPRHQSLAPDVSPIPPWRSLRTAGRLRSHCFVATVVTGSSQAPKYSCSVTGFHAHHHSKTSATYVLTALSVVLVLHPHIEIDFKSLVLFIATAHGKESATARKMV